ncbi:MAG: dihydroneopterin aldolase [Lysobacteraceae bacterium]
MSRDRWRDPAAHDAVFLDRLNIDTVIGIHPHEQTAPQPLRLSLRMGFDNRRPAVSDDLADTLDYAAIATRLRAHAQGRAWRLIETLAESCADLLHAEFGVRRLWLRIDKPQAVPEAESVGVEIQRRWNDGRAG